eukprot:scaffold77877_cov58-Phaeocystis_antarctica.AAC.2
MGREWGESLVLIGVSTLQLASQEVVASVVFGVSISIQSALLNIIVGQDITFPPECYRAASVIL